MQLRSGNGLFSFRVATINTASWEAGFVSAIVSASNTRFQFLEDDKHTLRYFTFFVYQATFLFIYFFLCADFINSQMSSDADLKSKLPIEDDGLFTVVADGILLW